MNVLFEEDGAFRCGAVLAEQPASLQVELPSGKRSKVKAANVLLRFVEPSPALLLERAEAQTEDIDTDFLWEVCGEAEFGFEELASEYFGHSPASAEATAILLRLHAAPIYFHRKGRGRFRKAPPDILKAALAGLEKKRLQALAIERMAGELQAGELPAEIAPIASQILYKPDRNRLETKAVELACAETGLTPARLLHRAGALGSAHEFHLNRFLFECFPEGTALRPFALDAPAHDLPRAEVAAFSIDDAATTEIDDAFSVTPLATGGFRVGIHIAAPGLAFAPDSPLAALARRRLSTVYMPGHKITMLPEAVVDHYTLAAGADRAAVSLYLDVASDLSVTASHSRIERVPVVANLRHHDIEPLFNEATLSEGGPDFVFKPELTRLWELACVLEAGRGKPSANQNAVDFSFYVDWSEAEDHEPGCVDIVRRSRGSPLDKLVAELMIFANSTWGKQLADAGVAGIYRAQSAGKVRMTTVAAPHEGLGVDQYAWSSSPLRRYVDLVNQWQLIALLGERPAPFVAQSADLLAAMRDFELTYATYAEFQRGMERYWCLRWLSRQAGEPVTAVVLRESLLRLEAVPLFIKVPSLPALDSGTRVRIVAEHVDFFESEARCRYVETLAAGDGDIPAGNP